MRGKVISNQYIPITLRITPACAGKRPHLTKRVRVHQDHPRVCVEKAVSCSGSTSAVGITPACAGKSDHLALSHSLPQDHPRVCGEKNSALSSSDSHSGSPPRVRGKGTRRVRRSPRRRITPACAGKSVLPSPEGFGMGDHPRVCGEKLTEETENEENRGSPPRVRGKAHDHGSAG